MPDAPMTEYVTVGDVAKALRVGRPTLYRWMRDGTLPYFELPGSKQRRFKRADVARLLTPGVPGSPSAGKAGNG